LNESCCASREHLQSSRKKSVKIQEKSAQPPEPFVQQFDFTLHPIIL